MSVLSDATGIAKRVGSDFSDKNVTFMAAGIAYNAFVSLAPLVILLLFAVSTVGGGLEERLISTASGALPGPIAEAIRGIAESDSSVAGASIIGVVVLLWGTLKIFRGLDTAFSEIYETVDDNSFTDQIKDGLVVLAAIAIAIVATVGVTALFAALSDTLPFIGLLTPLVLIAGLVVAFLPMYKRFPDADLEWRDALPGAVVGAVGWAAMQALFQVYLAFKGGGSSGFFGGVIVIVTWLYFSGLVLLLGAVLNSVLGGHSTGQPGGVGASVAQRGTEIEVDESMEREELSRYLRDLRARLTGRYEEMDPYDEDHELAVDGGRTRTVSGVEADESVVPSERTPTDAPGDGEMVVREVDGTLRTYRPHRAPDDPVHVFERSRVNDGERVHEVTITWRTPEPAAANGEGDGDGDGTAD